MIFRPRRLRRTAAIRDMAAETRLSPSMLVYPVFIREGKNIIEDIPAMPGQKRYSPDTFPKFLEETANAGIKSILLFGLPEQTSAEAARGTKTASSSRRCALERKISPR